MGCSDWQGILIARILKFLYQNLDDSMYEVITNEIGLHLAKGSNLSSDIVIYDKKEFQNYSLRNQYLRIPPRVVIEIDITAEAKELSDNQGYVHKK